MGDKELPGIKGSASLPSICAVMSGKNRPLYRHPFYEICEDAQLQDEATMEPHAPCFHPQTYEPQFAQASTSVKPPEALSTVFEDGCVDQAEDYVVQALALRRQMEALSASVRMALSAIAHLHTSMAGEAKLRAILRRKPLKPWAPNVSPRELAASPTINTRSSTKMI